MSAARIAGLVWLLFIVAIAVTPLLMWWIEDRRLYSPERVRERARRIAELERGLGIGPWEGCPVCSRCGERHNPGEVFCRPKLDLQHR